MKNQPLLYKNIKVSIDELSIIIHALNTFVDQNEGNIQFYAAKLNASSSPKEVRNNQDYLKLARKNQKDALCAIEQIENSELRTGHKLY